MTLERILQAAVNSLSQGKRKPHCFSAWVKGKGYVNDGTLAEDMPEYTRQAISAAQTEVDNIGYAAEYAEPGYSNPKCGILFANWNNLPRNLDSILERLGYAIEWSDEWGFCDDCGRAFRTSPDSYSWQRNSVYNEEDGSELCHDCVNPAEHLRSLEDNPQTCNTIESINPADYGYVKFNGRFESGWHPGQDDNPVKITERMRELGFTRILFNLDRAQQFDIYFSAWYHPEEETDID